MTEEPAKSEMLARRLAAAAGGDPDHMVLPPWLVPMRIPVVGGYAYSAQGIFEPVPLWRCYHELAAKMLRDGDVFL